MFTRKNANETMLLVHIRLSYEQILPKNIFLRVWHFPGSNMFELHLGNN